MKSFRAILCARRAHPTVSSYINDAITVGRSFLRSFVKVKGNLEKTIAFSPSKIEDRNFLQKGIYSIRRTFSHQVSKCTSNSFAARLRRNAAKQLLLGGGGGLSFVGLSLAKGPTLLTEKQQMEKVTWEIRNIFSSFFPPSSDDLDSATGLNDFRLGQVLAKGCNAVVYSAQKVTEERPVEDVTMSITKSTLPVGPLAPYNIAIKMMFNYEAESNAMAIWKAMNKEILPAKAGMFGENVSFWREKCLTNTHLPSHPNIVDMHFAFADKVPYLPEAMTLFPDALPVKLNENGCGRNMTLFIVMKRYHCTLLQYLQAHKPTYHTSLLLLTQLLEAVTHLNQHEIAHRDLKLDNILIDLTAGISNPHLVITDFGCCLSEKCSLKLPLPSEEVYRGGNVALMAPEVITASPGLFSFIDYTRADLWTVGTLAYQIFGEVNPFSQDSALQLRNYLYKEEDLPSLPSDIPSIITKLIKHILRIDLKKRPSPSFCATVCQLLIHAPRHWLRSPEKDHNKVLEWLVSTAGTTLWLNDKSASKNSIEQQLRITFLSRAFLAEVLEALEYIATD